MRPPQTSRRIRAAGLLGALVGAAAAGAASGIAVRRIIARRGGPPPPDRYTDEPFDELPVDEELTVTTEDGVDLHVEIVEPPGAGPPDLTVVYVHGFALDMGTFHFQRKELTGCAAPRLRHVFFDQPGHGRSGRLEAGRYTIEALGEALNLVIGKIVPDGPLALVGHSMGGMAIMALAEQQPDLFGPPGRIRAIALISTSSGRLAEVPFGLPNALTRVRQRVLPVLTGAARLTPAAIDRARGAATDLSYELTRRFGFARPDPSPTLVSYVERMNSRTSIAVIAGFVSTLFEHSRYTALAALARTPVLVIGGDADVFTPLSHSEEICRALPDAELLVVEQAGHMALLEYPDIVNPVLRTLLEKAAPQAPDTSE